MSHEITFSATSYQRLKQKAIGGLRNYAHHGNPDGSFTFPIDDEVFKKLTSIDPDPEETFLKIVRTVK